MTIRWHAFIVIGSVVLALTSPVAAHHGAAGLFDETQTVEVTGSVKEWSLVNPHPILVLEVTDENGYSAYWDIYLGPAGVPALRRRGYTHDTFMIGETLIVKGHPATTAGVRGIDVWGGASGVTRGNGATIP